MNPLVWRIAGRGPYALLEEAAPSIPQRVPMIFERLIRTERVLVLPVDRSFPARDSGGLPQPS